MPLQQAQNIELRASTIKALPDEIRTPQRDEVARYILNDVIPEGRWPMPMTELAKETGYSRQHVSNVTKLYFKSAGESSTEYDTRVTTANQRGSSTEKMRDGRKTVATKTIWADLENSHHSIKIEVPHDVSNQESYTRGYLDAKLS